MKEKLKLENRVTSVVNLGVNITGPLAVTATKEIRPKTSTLSCLQKKIDILKD